MTWPCRRHSSRPGTPPPAGSSPFFRHSDARRDPAHATIAPDSEVPLSIAGGSIRLRALQSYTQHKRRLPDRPLGSELARLLVLDSLIYTVEAEVRWLDHIEQRLISDVASNDRPTKGSSR